MGCHLVWLASGVVGRQGERMVRRWRGFWDGPAVKVHHRIAGTRGVAVHVAGCHGEVMAASSWALPCLHYRVLLFSAGFVLECREWLGIVCVPGQYPF